MFNNQTWNQIHKNLKYKSQNSCGHYMLFTKPGNHLNLVKFVRDDIYMADKKNPEDFELVSKESFENVYNELVYNRELSHSAAMSHTKEKKWAGALMAVLALLSDVSIDDKSGTLKYR